MFDKDKREKLVEKINQLGDMNDFNHVILVSIDDFFDGNGDDYSMGCNLMEHPGIDVFYRTLKEFSEHSEVEDVYVDIYDLDEGEWPFSETVYFATTLEVEYVKEKLSILEFSDIWVVDSKEVLENVKLTDGYKLIGIWWD